MYDENSFSHRYVLQKGNKTLMAFSAKTGYSFLTLSQKPIKE
jgi:hypothetical protein